MRILCYKDVLVWFSGKATFLPLFFLILAAESARKLSMTWLWLDSGKGVLPLQSQEGAVGAKTTRNVRLHIAVLINTASSKYLMKYINNY